MAKRELVLKSTFDQLERAVEFIEHFVEEHELGDDLLERLRLVGSEAVTNAIEHGNGLDPEKRVSLLLEMVDENVEMRVSDEGPGFDTASLPDPTSFENLLAEGGRGIYFIHHFSDTVTFENDGTVLCARFAIPHA